MSALRGAAAGDHPSHTPSAPQNNVSGRIRGDQPGPSARTTEAAALAEANRRHAERWARRSERAMAAGRVPRARAEGPGWHWEDGVKVVEADAAGLAHLEARREAEAVLLWPDDTGFATRPDPLGQGPNRVTARTLRVARRGRTATDWQLEEGA